jgi:hypothetical protein
MSSRSLSGISVRVLFGGFVILGIVGCVSQADRDAAALEALTKEQQLRDNSPETTVWIHNRTGEPIREVGMMCKSVERPDKSKSYGTSWTRETTVEGEPKVIWSEKYPEPLVLETLKVRFDKGARSEYQLNHRCQPGDKVVLVIETGGRVTVKAKE